MASNVSSAAAAAAGPARQAAGRLVEDASRAAAPLVERAADRGLQAGKQMAGQAINRGVGAAKSAVLSTPEGQAAYAAWKVGSDPYGSLGRIAAALAAVLLIIAAFIYYFSGSGLWTAVFALPGLVAAGYAVYLLRKDSPWKKKPARD